MGEYTLLMMKSITLPDRWSMFFKQLIKEIYKLGVDSLWIVIIISVFIGTVIAIQISLNISSPLIPKFTIGYTTREIILLEFSSSIMALILAGKVGSNIASEIGFRYWLSSVCSPVSWAAYSPVTQRVRE